MIASALQLDADPVLIQASIEQLIDDNFTFDVPHQNDSTGSVVEFTSKIKVRNFSEEERSQFVIANSQAIQRASKLKLGNTDDNTISFEKSEELVIFQRPTYIDDAEYKFKTLYKISKNGFIVRLNLDMKWVEILEVKQRLAKCVSFPDETVFLIGGTDANQHHKTLKSVIRIKMGRSGVKQI